MGSDRGRTCWNKPLVEALPELRGQPFISLLDDVFRTGVPYLGKEATGPLPSVAATGQSTRSTSTSCIRPSADWTGKSKVFSFLRLTSRTRWTPGNEMQHLRRAAESANRTKDEFLAMLGHELRNPLAPILTALQLMTLRGDASLGTRANVIERQVQHLVRLVDDLLDVSRITRGKIELRRQPSRWPRSSHRRSRRPVRSSRSGSTSSKSGAAHGLVVSGDVTRLAQVVVNMLTNAAKYTEPRGRISVTGQRVGDRWNCASRTAASGSLRTCFRTCSRCSPRSHQASRSIARAVSASV